MQCRWPVCFGLLLIEVIVTSAEMSQKNETQMSQKNETQMSQKNDTQMSPHNETIFFVSDGIFNYEFQPLSNPGNAALIGGHGGDFFVYHSEGKVIQRIDVSWTGSYIRGLAFRYFGDQTTYYVNHPIGSAKWNYFEFQAGETLKGNIVLKGDGRGQRLGYIYFQTNKGNHFEAGESHAVDEYHFDAEGSMVSGFIGAAAWDIDRLGFILWKPVVETQVQNMQYPTLDSLAVPKAPKLLDRRSYENANSKPMPAARETSVHTVESESKHCWKVGLDLALELGTIETAPIPEFATTFTTKAKWHVGLKFGYNGCSTEKSKDTVVFEYPTYMMNACEGIDYTYTRWEGHIDKLPFTATLHVVVEGGASVDIPMTGSYSGVSFQDIRQEWSKPRAIPGCKPEGALLEPAPAMKTLPASQTQRNPPESDGAGLALAARALVKAKQFYQRKPNLTPRSSLNSSLGSQTCADSFETFDYEFIPLSFPEQFAGIGGCGGKHFQFHQHGKVLKRLEVVWTDNFIRGIYFQYFQDPALYKVNDPWRSHSRKSIEIQPGETLVGDIILKSDGAGKRLGYIHFETSLGQKFTAGDSKADHEYHFPAGGSMISGLIGRADWDIDNLGFTLWKPLKRATLVDVHYPTLGSLAVPEAPVQVAGMTYANLSPLKKPVGNQHEEKELEMDQKHCFKVDGDFAFDWELSASEGVPKVEEVGASVKWHVGVNAGYNFCYTGKTTEKRTFNFPVVEIDPCTVMSYTYSRWEGRIAQLPFHATFHMELQGGGFVDLATDGHYEGVSFTKVVEAWGAAYKVPGCQPADWPANFTWELVV